MTRGKAQTSPSVAVHRAEHVFRLIERLKLSWLLAHLPPNAVWESYVFVNSFVTIGVLAVLAFLTHNPFVFPSLGPTTARWMVANGVLTVNKEKAVGNIETKRTFKNYQLHLEWKVPENITGTGQARGNSGVFLASTGPGDAGYELQVLDSYKNKTYVNGQAGSIYKQAIPLANPSRKPGEWQTYDVVWTAPTFNADSSLKTPAYVTVFFNGVLVQNHFELKGETLYIGKPVYKKYDRTPIKLQAHGDPSEPVSFRNIWVRELN
jgi:hypothetical protein